MKKTAETEKKGLFERFCSAQENKARISLIIAAAIVVTTVGTVCAAAIRSNHANAVPSDNMQLNIAEEYLARAAADAGINNPVIVSDTSAFISEGDETRATKRGGLTGERVADISDLKSLSDEELLAQINAGNVGIIDRSQMNIDQSENSNAGHKASGGDATATDTPTPVPENEPTPTMEPITTLRYELGIDISEFQGSIDWSAVRDSGITFAFIRCGGRGYSKGGIYDDNRFYTNVANAQAAGIKVGVYFFSQAITVLEAAEEASVTLEKISGLSIDLPVVLDWETGSGYRTEDLWGEDFANVINAFCGMVAQHGYTPAVYLNTSDINSRLGGYSGEILSKYRLWYAYPYACYSDGSYYQEGDMIPPRSFSYEYWQYSWRGDVPGISTDVDLNIRILGKTTLGVPEIDIPNTSMTSEAGQDFDPLDGVTAETSQGDTTTSNLSYVIKDSNGQEVSLETARNTIGTYKIVYTFSDAFRGDVTADATWTVTEASTPTPSPSDQTDPTGDPTNPTGDPTDPSDDPTEPTGDASDPSEGGESEGGNGDAADPTEGDNTAA